MSLGGWMVFAVALSLIITSGTTMNLMVLVVLYKNKTLRHHIASVFIANLALIDLLNLVFVMPFSVQLVVKGRWVHGNTLCQMNGLFGTLFNLASILTLAAISLDRWAAVMKPLVYRARMTPTHAVYSTLYVWFQAVIFSVTPAIQQWYVVNMRYYSCTFPSANSHSDFLAYMGISYFCNIGISLIIMLVTYFCVFRVARSHSRRIAVALVSVFSSEHRKIRKETVRQREAKTAIKISFVIGAFLICYLPYSIVRVLELIGPTGSVFDLPDVFLVSVKWTVYLKSAVNPFIYSLLQQRFRRALIELFVPSQRSNIENFNFRHRHITESRSRPLRESNHYTNTTATATT
eukprot:gene5661-6357_t